MSHVMKEDALTSLPCVSLKKTTWSRDKPDMRSRVVATCTCTNNCLPPLLSLEKQCKHQF